MSDLRRALSRLDEQLAQQVVGQQADGRQPVTAGRVDVHLSGLTLAEDDDVARCLSWVGRVHDEFPDRLQVVSLGCVPQASSALIDQLVSWFDGLGGGPVRLVNLSFLRDTAGAVALRDDVALERLHGLLEGVRLPVEASGACLAWSIWPGPPLLMPAGWRDLFVDANSWSFGADVDLSRSPDFLAESDLLLTLGRHVRSVRCGWPLAKETAGYLAATGFSGHVIRV